VDDTRAAPPHFRVAIIGTGFAGLGMAVRLKRAGLRNLVLLERAEDLGGTWRDNTYPGAACDVPSHLYSFSFAANPDWSRSFSGQAEIADYLLRVAKEEGVVRHMRFGHEVHRAQWRDRENHWRVETCRGPLTAQFLISGAGPLADPKLPDIPGLTHFHGPVFHSARWDHDYDLRGKRVASVGTGASAIQYVPAIQPQVERLHVFQRTPPWVFPHTNRRITRLERRLYRALPAAQRLVRGGIYAGRETFVLGFVKNPRLMRAAEALARQHRAIVLTNHPRHDHGWLPRWP
jgi:cation diffusion facilitator CzcD-associated flavoprotein CzcO